MLRRDFLKLLGIAGITVSFPKEHKVDQTLWTTAQFDSGDLPIQSGDQLKAAYKKPQSCILNFTFKEPYYKLVVGASEGKFTFDERSEWEYTTERGRLFDFCLEFRCVWISDATFYQKVQNCHIFDMSISDVDELSYILTDALWESLAYDLLSGDFQMSGRCRLLKEQNAKQKTRPTAPCS